jgi:hypothetical protein
MSADKITAATGTLTARQTRRKIVRKLLEGGEGCDIEKDLAGL